MKIKNHGSLTRRLALFGTALTLALGGAIAGAPHAEAATCGIIGTRTGATATTSRISGQSCQVGVIGFFSAPNGPSLNTGWRWAVDYTFVTASVNLVNSDHDRR